MLLQLPLSQQHQQQQQHHFVAIKHTYVAAATAATAATAAISRLNADFLWRL